MKNALITLSFFFVLILTGCSKITVVDNSSTNPNNYSSVVASSTSLLESNVSSTSVSSQSSQDASSFGSDGCSIHTGYYHAIDSRLINYVGQDKMDAFVQKYGWGEENNIVNFVKFCGIDKETFQKLIDEYDLNADAQYSGGNGYDVDVIFSNDDKKVQEYYGIRDKSELS